MELGNAIQTEQFLSGGGEMGDMIRGIDWTLTPVGPVSTWPQSLRTSISIMLNAHFPMYIAWGSEFTQFYNDGYRPILGSTKHPQAMGISTKLTFAEIWHIIGPMFEGVMEGKAVGFEDFMLPLDRHGYTEECYFIFSYSPIKQENGRTGGVLVTVTETTQRVLSERRLNTLSELGEKASQANNAEDAVRNTLSILNLNRHDIPFCLFFMFNDKNNVFEFAGATGIDANKSSVDMFSHFVNNTDATEIQQHSMESFHPLSFSDGMVWPERPNTFTVVRLERQDLGHPLGILVLGNSPRLPYDERYNKFFKLIADHSTTGLSNARAFEQERRRTQALSEVDKAKTTFFSNISHEFRTPLTLILGPLEELLNNNKGLSKEQIENIEATHRNSVRLLRLVNTLLDFSRIEAGRVSARYYNVDLCEFTSDLASNFRSVIEGAGLKFEVQCDVIDQPTYVDREMWEKIVLNLLSNAFKYTLEGKITLRLFSTKDFGVLEVEDTGVGIPDEELPKMFERFHRVKNTGARTFEGTGIGLSLVKELVDLHQGNIEVVSEEGKGSKFIVSLPLGKEHLQNSEVLEGEGRTYEPMLSDAYVSEANALIGNRTSNEHKLKASGIDEDDTRRNRSKVLVVDDNSDMREYIKKLLDPLYDVRTAENGSVALKTVGIYRPDVIVSDIMMPVMDGIELLQEIKKNTDTQKTPVILLSARAGEEARIEGYDMGADDYLIKPFAAKELVARVKAQIKIADTRRSIEMQMANAFNLAPVATSILRGRQLVVVQANELMLELWGKTSEDVMNKPLFVGVSEAAGQGFEEILDNVFMNGERFVTTEHIAYLKREGGVEKTILNFVYEPLREVEGAISGIIVVANDVTALATAKQLAQDNANELEKIVASRTSELKASNDQLLKTNSDLEQFAYVSSHDLQEPLRKIQIFTELASNNLKQEEVAMKYLDKIDSSASRMSTLIKGVLSYSKLSGVSTYAPVDLNAVLRNVLDDYELLISQKEAIVNVSQLPVINAIELQIFQLFSNLVNNSLKFSERQPVIDISSRNVSSIEYEQYNLDTAKQYISIQFKDNGIGFEPQFSEKIFTLFQRLNNKREYEGTGIGLALCKKIVENHNGLIHVASTKGEGSIFNVFLPI
jgi:signal transduction histidine kinase